MFLCCKLFQSYWNIQTFYVKYWTLIKIIVGIYRIIVMAFCAKTIRCFSSKNPVLQIQLYHDDFQVTNPLGSKTIKISAFYYTLGNIKPKHRSKLSVIQLAVLAESKYVNRNNLKLLLRPMIEDLKHLEQNGIPVNIDDMTTYVKGTVSFVAADNLASHFLGGFYESFSIQRFCRFCMCTRRALKSGPFPSIHQERTIDNYDRHVSLVTDDSSLSSVYGVKNQSVLNDLQYFHVTEGLPPDVAHDLLEGVCKDTILKIVSGVNTYITDINLILETFPYKGSDKATKPSTIRVSGSDIHMKQSASQIWCLCRLLPVMFGTCIPARDPHWNLLLLMLDVLEIATSPIQTSVSISLLKSVIEEFLYAYIHLFGCDALTLTPKYHFLVHYPIMMARFGPLIHCWTLRYEAKHSYFKEIARRTKNMKNICKTLASRHQFLQCHFNSAKNFLEHDNLEMNHVSSLSLATLHPDIHTLVHNLTAVGSDSLVQAQSVTLDGVKYSKGSTVVLDIQDGFCHFGRIDIIIIHDDIAHFVTNKLKTLEFCRHYHAYIVFDSYHIFDVVKVENLLDYYPLEIYKVGNTSYIPLKHRVNVELCG